jgi:hypothetical protein
MWVAVISLDKSKATPANVVSSSLRIGERFEGTLNRASYLDYCN